MHRISRRAALKLALATPLGLGVRVPAFGAEAEAPAQILIVYGLTENTTRETLVSLLQPLLDRRIPVTVAIDPEVFPGAAELPRQALGWLLEAPENIVTIAPFTNNLPAGETYFQGRVGHELRSRFNRLMEGQGASRERLSNCTTLALKLAPVWTRSGTQEPAPSVAAPGLRAAGFRTVLQLHDMPVPREIQQTENGVLTLSGGARLLYDPLRNVQPMVESALQKNNFGLISLYLKSVINADPWAGLTQNAGKSANSGSALAPTDSPRPRAFPVDLGTALGDPASLLRHSSAAFSRHISAVILRAEGQAPGADAAPRVLRRLNGIGVPASVLDAPSPGVGGARQGRMAPGQPSLLPIDLPLDGTEAGIDRNGALVLGAVHRIEAGMTQDDVAAAVGGSRDIVLVIDAAALDDPDIEAALFAALTKVRAQGGSRFLSLDAFAASVLSEDPVTQLEAETHSGRRETRIVPADKLQADALMEDAKLAWRYIERFTVRRTGLCKPTAQVVNGYVSTYDSLAMWDVGSQLQGVRAAYRLGLIDHDEFVGRTKRAIEHLPRTRIAGRLLPGSLVRATNGRIVQRSFYPSDIGRLLSAFALLRRDPALAATVDRAVGRWQLNMMVRNKRLQEVVDGEESEFFVSQGAHYAARAFAEFGIHVQSPYPERGADSEADWKMRLLYATGAIGPLGPEPLLQEGIEMGFSAPSAFLAHALFAAQFRSNKSTNAIVCPSESPIDRSPWFIYEGLRIADTGPRWSLQSDSQAANSQPGTARQVPLLASSKAAFMWAAVHPHPYSMRMLDYVRTRARVAGAGFASGVYVETGMQTQGYMDLNTNGVILSAIDHMLNPPISD